MINNIESQILGIKHMAFAVEEIESALNYYKKFIGVSESVKVIDMPKSRTRVAVFEIGGIEYQLCQSQDKKARFSSWIKQRGIGGLHHICYIVKNLSSVPFWSLPCIDFTISIALLHTSFTIEYCLCKKKFVI